VSAGSRGTALGVAPKASQHPPSQHVGKRKANKLANSGDSNEPANRCPAPGAGSATMPAFSSVMGERAAFGSRQLGPPKGEVMYTAVLAGPVTTIHHSGSLNPTAIDSEVSKPAASCKTANRRMSSDMSGPLSYKPVGTTLNAQMANTGLPATVRPNKTPIFISGVHDTRAFLA
jgi:hypothetical protein